MRRLFWIFFLAASAVAASPQAPFTAPDQKPEFQEVRASSLYVPVRDGVRIAIDVLLPERLPAGRKVPAIFKFSNFGRAAIDGSISEEDLFWVQRGFARVLVDERGTGASFGTSRYGADTVPDLYDLADWVVKQPWSNGRVGATGISVEGTASELFAATNHPAVRAVAPWFSDYNYYTDLLRPGGMFNEWILKNFEDFTLQMDSGGSAKHVDNDPGDALMKQAIAEHRSNLDIYSAIKNAPFIDDPLPGTGKTILDISIPGVAAALRKSHVPMLVFASWYDAGTVQGTIQRFRDFSNSQRIFVGAWSHGAGYSADPFLPSHEVQPSQQQQWLEALQFFSHYLIDTPKENDSDRRFSYYTIGKNAWQSTDVWPPKGLRNVTYQLNSPGNLDTLDSRGSLKVKLQPSSTGQQSRWRTQLGGGPVDYTAALNQMSALTSFVTAPLQAPLEITGQAILRLRLTCAQQDPSIVAYLLAIDPQGKPFYLTEGHLRLSQRKFAASEQTLHTYTRRDAQSVSKDQEIEADLTLLPTSVLLRSGTRLQLLLASGDDGTFASTATYEATIFSRSQLELPVR
jgi:putative CocE/NonD family hydrolase